jgi:hypothetical protein
LCPIGSVCGLGVGHNFKPTKKRIEEMATHKDLPAKHLRGAPKMKQRVKAQLKKFPWGKLLGAFACFAFAAWAFFRKH